MEVRDAVEGTVSVITGASRGIGRELALTLARRGATVVVNYQHDDHAAAEVVASVSSAGGRAVCCRADVEDPAGIEKLFTFVEESFGRLDHFVSNAAAGPFKPVLDLKLHHLDRCHAMNARAFVLGAQRAARLMDRGGRIVAMSSLGAGFALPGYAAMGAEKAALEAWVRYLACELAPLGITANAVSGGLIDTGTLALYARSAGFDPDAAVRRVPLQRAGTPGDMASAAAFLLSPAADYITGQTLVVDGGISVSWHTQPLNAEQDCDPAPPPADDVVADLARQPVRSR